MRACIAAIVPCCVLLGVNHLTAATRYVNCANPTPVSPYLSWAAAATNIQDALDVSSDSDIVLVTNGVYAAGGTAVVGNELLSRVCLTNAVTVRSVNGPTHTFIIGAPDPVTGAGGSNAVRCALVSPGAMLCGFTLTGGWTWAVGNAAGPRAGGGVYLNGGGVVSNCVIAGNTAAGNGGGVYCADGGYVMNALIVSNSANKGGGLFLRHGRVAHCEITHNNSDTTGGGVHARKSGAIAHCLIAHNRTVDDGAGVLCTENASLRDSTIGYNNAHGTYGTGGGVILYYGGEMERCVIVSNYSRYTGGGVAIYAGNGTMNNCLVYRNICQSYGGGVYCYAGGGPVANCTIAENRSYYYYGGVNCNYTGIFHNCTIYYNKASSGADEIGGNHGVAYNCCIPTNGGLATVVNWITNAPEFVARPADDFRLQAGSPCIDSGSDPLAGGTTDLDGVGRIIGLHVDRGCYEFHNNAVGLPAPAITQPQAVSSGGAGAMAVTNTLALTVSGTKLANALAAAPWVTNGIDQALNGTTWTQAQSPLENALTGAWNTFAFRSVRSNLYIVSTNVTILHVVSHRMFPFVDITNAPYWVTYDVTTAVISGTNNKFVVGGMRWTNTKTHVGGLFPAGSPWFVGGIGLDVGNNTIIVRGTNNLGDISEDSVIVTRYQEGTGTPVIGITNAPAWVYYDENSGQVSGTNVNIVGQLYWVNNRHPEDTNSFPTGFSRNVNNLEIGDNLITVFGTNVFGIMASDSVTIHRQTADERFAVTNYVRLDSATAVAPYDSWATAASNIQDALAAASVGLTGTVVVVSNGTYVLPATVALRDPLMLTSLNGPDVTILDGNASWQTNRCLLLNHSLAVAEGFTVTNAYWTANGGAAFVGRNGGTIRNFVFTHCAASAKGGGLYLNRAGVIEWCRFVVCTAGNWGGGIHLEQGGALYNSTFTGCHATALGGGASVYGGGRLYTCLFTHNSARRGGGVYTRYHPSRLDNCTIVSNSAEIEGGGLYIREGPDLRGSVVYYNIAPTNENFYRYGSVDVQNSCTYPKLGNPCITNEPGFVDPSCDYHLLPTSPCINAGPTYQWMNGRTDLDGHPRVSGGFVDLGVYETDTDPIVTITNAGGLIAYPVAQCAIGGSNNQWVAGMLWWTNHATGAEGPLGPFDGATNWIAPGVGLDHGDNEIVVCGSNAWGHVVSDSVLLHRETYAEGIPKIASNALIYPCAGSVVQVDEQTNVVWNPLGITDEIDGTNLTLTSITIHRSNDLVEVDGVATNVPNLAGRCPWDVPTGLLSPQTSYVVRFEVVDSNALTNSMVFVDDAFIVVPEPLGVMLVLALTALRGRQMWREF